MTFQLKSFPKYQRNYEIQILALHLYIVCVVFSVLHQVVSQGWPLYSHCNLTLAPAGSRTKWPWRVFRL